MRVGSWLLTERNKIKVNDLSAMLGVSRRTLANWKKQAKRSRPRPGRPRYSESQRIRALISVGREWKRQGTSVGWRPVHGKLEGTVPTRLLQSTLSRLKLLHRNQIRKDRALNRQSARVNFKNVLWVQDGTKHQGAQFQVIKDRGSLKVLSVRKNGSDNAQAVLDQLKCTKMQRGLPLVIGTDNGSMYTSKKVQEFLEENKVIHLRSLPRTPQHNGAMECAIREIKEVATLDNYSMEQAAGVLNGSRLRARFLFKSSEQADEEMTAGYDEDMRTRFFEICRSRFKIAEAGSENARSKRMTERKIVFETLEQFGFIELNRGGLV